MDTYPADSTKWEVSTPLNDINAFVQQGYQDFLGRDADASGLTDWTGVMDGGGSGLALIEGFLSSGEYAARF